MIDDVGPECSVRRPHGEVRYLDWQNRFTMPHREIGANSGPQPKYEDTYVCTTTYVLCSVYYIHEFRPGSESEPVGRNIYPTSGKYGSQSRFFLLL